LITGAASGIGRATARLAAARGARLVLTDVQHDALEQTAASLAPAVTAHRALDITELDAVRAFAEDVHREHGALDVAMNVAGIATWGPIERLTHVAWQRTIEVNLMGPIHVLETFVAEMVRAGRGGQLVNVASGAGLLGLPWHAPYSATKFGLRGISEVLRFDLRRHRIGVTLVCPGGVNTSLVDTVDIAGVQRESARAQRLTERFRSHAVTPERAAEKILDGLVRNRYLVYTSSDVRLAHALQRYVPPVYELAMRLGNDFFVAELADRAR
jgi:NAD(P)-dependent dehydrogenase (short-subunit alcohol dehydrogenase family)